MDGISLLQSVLEVGEEVVSTVPITIMLLEVAVDLQVSQ